MDWNETLKALADPNRLRVLNLLGDRTLCVCDLEEVLGLNQSNLSRHLAKLKAVLSYHVVAARVDAAHLKSGNLKSAQGANLAIAKAGDYVTVEEAMVQAADIAATNGVVHKVDRVLMPPKL